MKMIKIFQHYLAFNILKKKKKHKYVLNSFIPKYKIYENVTSHTTLFSLLVKTIYNIGLSIYLLIKKIIYEPNLDKKIET